MTTAIGLGGAAAAAVSGPLVDAAGASPAFAVTTLCGLLGGAVALLDRERLGARATPVIDASAEDASATRSAARPAAGRR